MCNVHCSVSERPVDRTVADDVNGRWHDRQYTLSRCLSYSLHRFVVDAGNAIYCSRRAGELPPATSPLCLHWSRRSDGADHTIGPSTAHSTSTQDTAVVDECLLLMTGSCSRKLSMLRRLCVAVPSVQLRRLRSDLQFGSVIFCSLSVYVHVIFSTSDTLLLLPIIITNKPHKRHFYPSAYFFSESVITYQYEEQSTSRYSRYWHLLSLSNATSVNYTANKITFATFYNTL